MTEPKPLGITDVVLRDAHQSLLATRLRIKECAAPPGAEAVPQPNLAMAPVGAEIFRVDVDGHSYRVRISPEGDLQSVTPMVPPATTATGPVVQARPIPAPLAGTVIQTKVKPGDSVSRGDLILILEAMKMETEVRCPEGGRVIAVAVKSGDSVQVGQTLLTLG